MRNVIAIALLWVAGTLAGQTTAPPPAQPAAPVVVPELPSVELPPELDRVLRDYEKYWQAKDANGLAAIFTEDGFVMSSGRPPVRGRAAIRERYAKSGGPLFLRAMAFATDGSVGYIIGGYRGSATMADEGKFILAVRKGSDGRWLIVADIDNGNQRPRPPIPPTPPTPPTPPVPPAPPSGAN